MSTPQYGEKNNEIGWFLGNEARFRNYPRCQRDFVWKPNMQQRLIDSILRGLPIPPLIVIERDQVLGSGTYFDVIDGQQRLETIKRFSDNKFTTMTWSDEPRMPLIEPGKKFDQLSSAMQAQFNQYPLRMLVLLNPTETDIGLMFRRLQYSEKLSSAEILFSYDTETRRVAEIVEKHPFFDLVWRGAKIDRKQRFHMGLYILFMEIEEGPCNMTGPRVKTLASGTRDKDAKLNTLELAKSISRRLDGLSVVYAGVTLHQVVEVIPVYQSAMMLENSGFDLQRSSSGCLAKWYMSIKETFLEFRRNGSADVNALVKLQQKYKQIEFWKNHFDTLMGCPGLFRKDEKRSFDLFDKVRLWNQQDGLCPRCGKTVRVDDIGHHKQQHSDGGLTVVENGELLHIECHIDVHRERSAKSRVTLPSHDQITIGL